MPSVKLYLYRLHSGFLSDLISSIFVFEDLEEEFFESEDENGREIDEAEGEIY